jgi:hypothetical protein
MLANGIQDSVRERGDRSIFLDRDEPEAFSLAASWCGSPLFRRLQETFADVS